MKFPRFLVWKVSSSVQLFHLIVVPRSQRIKVLLLHTPLWILLPPPPEGTQLSRAIVWRTFYIRNLFDFRLSVKEVQILTGHHKSHSFPQDWWWALSFSEHIPASEPQCHAHSLMKKREPVREYIVLGILVLQVRKKKQKYKKASSFLPENTKLGPALRAWLQGDLPVYIGSYKSLHKREWWFCI